MTRYVLEHSFNLASSNSTQLFTVDIPDPDRELEETAADVSEDEIEPTFEFLPESSSEERTVDGASVFSDTAGPSLWHDPADQQASVSLNEAKRLRKLARDRSEHESLTGNVLQSKLREQ